MFGFRSRGETAPDSDIDLRCAGYAAPSMTVSEPDQSDELLGQVAPPKRKDGQPSELIAADDATESVSQKVNEFQTAITA